jgi:hypothetical protein
VFVRYRGGSATHFQLTEQIVRGRRNRLDGTVEGFDIRFCRRSHSAYFAHVLQRGGGHFLLGGRLDKGRAQGLDAPAHSDTVTAS